MKMKRRRKLRLKRKAQHRAQRQAPKGITHQPHSALRANVLERAVLIENATDSFIASFLTKTPEREDILINEVLSRMPMSNKWKILGAVLELELGSKQEVQLLLRDVRDLFELRNSLAHAVATPQDPNASQMELSIWRRPGREPLILEIADVRRLLEACEGARNQFVLLARAARLQR
jgi:hypothetical protein